MHEAPSSDTTKLCGSEPIHLLGEVQSHGTLLACDANWTICFAAENSESILRKQADFLLEKKITDIFSLDIFKKIQEIARASSVTQIPVTAYSIQSSTTLLDITAHHTEHFCILEFEVSNIQDDKYLHIIQTLQNETQHQDISKILQSTVEKFQHLSGYDRVVAYQFQADGSGQVVAEQKLSTLESFLGLHFPATDIPPLARALYLTQKIRCIADVNQPTAKLIAAPDQEFQRNSLDLCHVMIRAVSPVHIEYLKNMGVTASMSISIIVDDQLWGLIACHHMKARTPSAQHRFEYQLFGQFLSDQIQIQCQKKALHQSQQLQHMQEVLWNPARLYKSSFNTISDNFTTLQHLVEFNGFGVYHDGLYEYYGQALKQESIHLLLTRPFLALKDPKRTSIFHTNALNQTLGIEHPTVAGILIIRLAPDENKFIFLFRNHYEITVSWAGNPNKAFYAEEHTTKTQLNPRKNFAAWAETIKGTSKPWTDPDRSIAHSLGITFIGAQFRHIQEKKKIQYDAIEKQEHLTKELNHRVRNALSLVQTIIMQSHPTESTTQAFAKSIKGRVAALTGAHDQLTVNQWEDIPLKALITKEICFRAQDSDYFDAQGPEVLLSPTAVTPTVICLHELFANSQEKGVLSDFLHQGTLNIRWSCTEYQNLEIVWDELFSALHPIEQSDNLSAMLIKRVISHELGGLADYKLTEKGLHCQITIPKNHINWPQHSQKTPKRAQSQKPMEFGHKTKPSGL